MIDKLPHMQKMMRCLQQIPFLASRNLYRVISHFLKMDASQIEVFCQTLKEAHAGLVECSICFAWHERAAACLYCSDARRDRSIICIVATWQDLLSLEQTRSFSGLYHVLGGVIFPLNGIGPEDLHISELIARINDSVKEVIFAMNQTPEGEATASFIAKKLQGQSIYLSCLAKGIPIGAALEGIDKITIHKALQGRHQF
jgi:recombination protein RecR